MQEALLKEVEAKLRANVEALDPETMLKTWLPAGLKGFEQLQEMFFSQMGRGRNSDAVALRTPRLLLREWRDEDIAPFVAMSADPEVMRASARPIRPRRSEEWLAGKRAYSARARLWPICCRGCREKRRSSASSV